MVEVLLAAIALALEVAPAFEFFINLSDADVSLRTAAEMSTFLGQFRGRSFVSIKFPEADAMRYHAHAHMRRSTWLECEGEGFVIVNQTAAGFFGAEGRRCCYARSGPIVYAELPIDRPPPPEGIGFYHGSQWVVLARNAAEWIVHDPLARQLAAHLRLSYMSDETFVQTALMASPLRQGLVNHNLRYIDWPHGYGDPNAYYQSVGSRHFSGPMVLTPTLFASVVRSPAIVARKVDLDDTAGADFVREWDAWMAAKKVKERLDASPAEAAEALTRLDAVGPQPPIASTLTQYDPMLSTVLAPFAGIAVRAVHFGHEDLMAKQFAPSPPTEPAAAANGLDGSLQPAGDGAVPREREQDAERQGGVRLASINFSDGSSCSCAARCGRVGVAACCDEWEQVAACHWSVSTRQHSDTRPSA